MPNSSAHWPISRVVAGCLLAALVGWAAGWGWQAAGERNLAKPVGQVAAGGGSGDADGLEPAGSGKGRIADAALPGLVQRVLASRQRDRRMYDLYEVAEKLSAAQFQVLIGLLQKQKDDELASEVLAYWFEADFANARAFVDRTPIKELDSWLLWQTTATWARMNAKDFEAWFEALPAKDKAVLGPNGIYTLVLSIAHVDPEGAVRLLTEGSGSSPAEGLEQVLEKWAKRDPAAAAARSLALPACRVRDDSIDAIVGHWVKKDLAGARSFVEGISDAQLRGKALVSLCEALKDTDPQSAAETLAQFKGSSYQVRDTFGKVLTAWAGKDLQAALDWANDLSDPQTQSSAFGSIIAAAAKNDPRLAMKLYSDAQGAGIDPRPETAAKAIALSLAKKEGVAAAGEFLGNLPAAEQKRAFQQASWPMVNLLGARAVAEQALQIPNEALRDDFLFTAASSMGDASDWKSATQALQRLPAGAERDAVTLRVAARALIDEPESATELFEATPGGHQRLMEEAGKWIASANRVGAEKWIRSSTALSDEERSALLEKLPASVTGTVVGKVPP